MNKCRRGIIWVMATLFLCGLVACGEQTVSVSFVQEGQETIIKTIKQGESLNDIPIPVEVEGYSISWDKMDFSNITESITVNAVRTPNSYTIYYEVGENVVISDTSQVVTYGESFVLESPTLKGKVFLGWKLENTDDFIQATKYEWARDITLTAEWDVANDNEYSYFY